MRLTLSAVCCLVLSVAVSAQERTASISGRVTEPSGIAATGITVEAKNVATGAVSKAPVSQQGDYTLSELAPGTYDISIPAAFGPFKEAIFVPFEQKGVTVSAGQKLQLNIPIQIQGNLATLGDMPLALNQGMRSQSVLPTGPTPRLEGKPDFSGLWLNQYKEDPPIALQPWAQQVRKERLDDASQSKRPKTLCLPSGPIQQMTDWPYQIIQGRDYLIFLQEVDIPGWRQVFLDGRKHPEDWSPTWLGHSVGAWEGDTLVIDTVGYNNKGWIQNGAPVTEKLHLIERLRRPDAGHLEIEYTAEDPGAFAGVWKGKLRATLGSKDDSVIEYFCENNAAIVPHLAK